MSLGVVTSHNSGSTDRTFVELNRRLMLKGWRVVGTVQQYQGEKVGRHCDMFVQVLPDGPSIQINQQLGAGARGCRLDVSALETAVAATEDAFAAGADLLIVNKFGKHEAEGRGFRALIAEALQREIPVICGLNDLNAAAFKEFAGGFAAHLPNDVVQLEAWLNDAGQRNIA